jgi:hypothetical protein
VPSVHFLFILESSRAVAAVRAVGLSIALATSLGCNSGGSTLDNLASSGALPELDRSDSLTGPDADDNGVRDDIDAYITRQYPKIEQAKAARQEARALQKALQVPAGDVAAAKAVVREMERATVCTYSQFPAGGSVEAARVGLEIEGLTANTKLRLKAYLAFNKTLDGTSSALPRGRACE